MLNIIGIDHGKFNDDILMVKRCSIFCATEGDCVKHRWAPSATGSSRRIAVSSQELRTALDERQVKPNVVRRLGKPSPGALSSNICRAISASTTRPSKIKDCAWPGDPHDWPRSYKGMLVITKCYVFKCRQRSAYLVNTGCLFRKGAEPF